MADFKTVEPSAEDIEDARRFFGSDPDAYRYISELLNEQELGDLRRTVRGTVLENVEQAIDSHPFASDSRKAKFRIALWLWSGHVRLRWTDPRRFDPDNRAKFIRAMRVFVGLPPAGAGDCHGWFPICGDCAGPEHSTFRGDPELACAKCGRPAEYIGIDYEEYEALPRVHPKEES